MIHTSNSIIVILPSMGSGWIGGTRIIKKTTKPRPPTRTVQPIPTFDRRALRERVDKFLRNNRHQREQLRAAACA